MTGIGLGKELARIGAKALAKPMMTYFTDGYVCHLALVS